MALYKINHSNGKDFIKHIHYVGNEDITLDQIPSSNFKKNALAKTTGYTLKQAFKLQVMGEAKANGGRKKIKRIIDFEENTTMQKAIKFAQYQYEVFIEEAKEALMNTEIAEVEESLNTITKNSTFEMVFDKYIEAKINTYKANNKKIPTAKIDGVITPFGYEIQFKNKHLTSLLSMPIGKILKKHLEEIMASMVHEDGKPLATRTKRRVLENVRQVYSYVLESTDVTVKNPGTMKGLPKLKNKRDVKVPKEQAISLYKALYTYEHPIYSTIFTFILYGRRIDEVLTLDWELLDIENKTYTILAEFNKARIDMEYILPDRIIEKLKKMGVKKKGYVFSAINNEKKMMNYGTLREHWLKHRIVVGKFKLNKRIVAAKKFRMHDIRHIIGGYLVNQGVSRDVIGVVLGHTQDSDEDITSRYSQIEIETAHDAIEGMIKEFII